MKWFLRPACVAGVAWLAAPSAHAEDDLELDDVGDAPDVLDADGSSVDDADTETSEDGAEASRFQLGLRLGFALPSGKVADESTSSSTTGAGGVTTTTTVTSGGDLGDEVVGMVPIWADLMYKVTPQIHLGLYAQVGFAILEVARNLGDPGCPEDKEVSCSAQDYRFGVEGAFHFSPTGVADPWLGLGVGYEIARYSISQSGTDASTTLRGLELAMLQAGLDFGAIDGVPAGPFVAYTFGRFTEGSVSTADRTYSGDVDSPAMHSWLVLGVRGGVDI